MTSKIKDTVKEWVVPARGEFRFEVAHGETIGLTLKAGCAEIFGTELAADREYEVKGAKLAVFSYEGATLVVRGLCEVEYVSEDSPTVPIYLNIHFSLENLRQQAAAKGEEPPRVLVIGSSRHTVAKVLGNYAVRSGRTPIIADLDTNRASLLFPGTLSAQPMDRVVDIEEGFSDQPGRIAYFYGHASPADNAKLYKKMAGRLAFALNSRLAAMDDPQRSGAILIAPADSGQVLADLRAAFRVSVILVIGNERLHSSIAKTATDAVVLKAPLSGGYVQLDSAFRRGLTQQLFRAYWYGARNEYTPFSQVLSFDEVHLRRLGESALAPSSALPLGATRKVSETRTTKVEPTKSGLLYAILGCSFATGDEEDQLTDTNCAGFVYVTAVDEQKKQLTVLSPCRGKLPSTFLIVGSIRWIES
jgi:polyribonucleotide 5'-hydroxyl-kinase